MPSATFFFTFLRTRAADGWAADGFAMSCFLRLRSSADLACLGVNLDRSLARPLARAGVGARALATDRQALAMAHAPVATQVHQTLDVHRHLAPQVPLDRNLRHLFPQPVDFGLGEILDLAGPVQPCGGADRPCARRTDAIDRPQRNLCVLLIRNVYTCNASHLFSLLVSGLAGARLSSTENR